MCSYSYTQRIWKKDILEIFYENDFFVMSIESIQKWKIITDILISVQKSNFNDLLSKKI